MNNKISGIYKIIHIDSGKLYVGCSIDVCSRLKGHKRDLCKNKHSSSHLQYAWNKYGEGAFSFEIIEQCSIEELLIREKFWIEQLKATDSEFGYNTCMYAMSWIGIAKSESQKEKIRIARAKQVITEESNQKRSETQKGKPKLKVQQRTPEENAMVRANISKAKKGRKLNMTSEQIQERNRKARESRVKNGNILHTEATREKISENRKGKGGGPMSLSRRMNISKALKGNPNNVGSTGKHTWTPRWKGQNRSPEVIEKITLSKRHKAMNDKQVSQFKALYPTNYGELLNVVNY